VADLELPVLEPPPGGLAKLRERIANDERRRVRWQWLAVPVVLAAAIALWLVVAQKPAARPVEAETLLPDPAMGGVAFYWVAPSTPEPVRSSPAFVDISAVSITP
jgi:hypothetical protein